LSAPSTISPQRTMCMNAYVLLGAVVILAPIAFAFMLLAGAAIAGAFVFLAPILLPAGLLGGAASLLVGLLVTAAGALRFHGGRSQETRPRTHDTAYAGLAVVAFHGLIGHVTVGSVFVVCQAVVVGTLYALNYARAAASTAVRATVGAVIRAAAAALWCARLLWWLLAGALWCARLLWWLLANEDQDN
jgi:hypothetical protein